ncbi:MAG: GDP-mannose 4,6-dehydratase [Chloroflexota bacterium]|nr:GDP-mannose 4,6-dehydratase [Chloroflexota bacterium]
MHQRVLITGIAGFVGSHVAERLLSESNEVHGVVRENPPDPTSLTSNVSLHRGDVTDVDSIERTLAQVRPDAVLHFAEPLPIDGISPELLRRGPSGATDALLQTMQRVCAVPFVYCSSAAVYGLPDSLPVREDAPLRARTPYAEGKVAAEALVRRYASIGQSAVILRPGNLLGPRQRSGLVASDFARQVAEIENGKEPPLLKHGRLDIERDFLDVRDLARACGAVLNAMRPGLDVFNVGSGRAVAISEIVRVLRAQARREIRLESEEARMRPGELRSIALDTSRLRRATGWSPAIPLERSIIDTLEYWRSLVPQA